MSTRILLQTILKLQDQIKTGAANFMDVSAEYFKSTGNFLDDSQKAVALEEINKTHEFIKTHNTKFSNYKILYGGSVKVNNAKEIVSLSNVDGALVGGASLKADDFSKIIED